VFNAFDMPARQSFVADMVPAQDLPNAIALNSSIFQGSRIVGPAVAGLLVSVVGEGWCFMINAVSFVAVLTGLLMMRSQFKRKPRTMSAWQSTMDGFRFVWNHGRIRRLLLLVATISLFGMSYMVLMPIISDRVLHGGVRGMGILMGASGVGALAGALKLARREHAEGLERRIAFSVMGFSCLLILFALCQHFWIGALLMVPIGYCQVSQMASSNTLLQSMISNEYRGRVMAVYGLMFMGMMPFGALISGHVANLLGTVTAVVMGASVTMLAGVTFWFRTRERK
jgi:predicted MFS family arabinose efflux permease